MYHHPYDLKRKKSQQMFKVFQETSNETRRQSLKETIQPTFPQEECHENLKNGFTTSSPIFNDLNQYDSKINRSTMDRLDFSNENKSGDWKYDCKEFWQTVELALTDKKTTQETTVNAEIISKNPYHISNCDNQIQLSNKSGTEITDYCSLKKSNSVTHKPRTLLLNIRERLANYQESKGIPRTEYRFRNLVKVMGQTTGRSLIALFYIIVNIAPIAEIFLYILRFILDKLINIKDTNDICQIIIKYVILVIQLLSIYVCLTFIFGLIILPILYMIFHIVAKVLSYNY
ncbi:hypothetical protein M0802_011892 [Mischocyttarus mexicanus]|nr:hypothetical protein M0802_011892 [Mischocyttarus mexicanus]